MSREPLIFDEDYTGPRFVYGMINRPPGIGCQPNGRIIGADRRDRPDPRVNHGTITYARQLTTDEIYGYELLPIDEHLAEYAQLSLHDVWNRLKKAP